MSNPTVFHLITRYRSGGAEKTTANALEALDAAPEEYNLGLGTGAEYDPASLSEIEDLGVKTVVFDSIQHYNPVTAVLAVVEVARYLRHHRVDILHTHSTEAGIIGRWAGALARTPIVVHEIHGDPIADGRHPLLNAFVFAVERASAPVTDHFVVKSERIRDTFLEREIGNPEQYELIYHGVDISRFRDAGSESEVDSWNGDKPMNEDVLRLLYVGRLAKGKGLDDLLDAVDRLDGVELRIAGDGPLTGRLEAEINRRNLPAELLGYRADVPELMAAADVLVLPSYREGTPRVVTEALAAGTPVVATDIAGIPEQVCDGETGYLIKPGDVDGLVSRLQDLASPERRQRFGNRAREQVEQFSVQTAKRRYQELYRKLASECSSQCR